MLRKLPQPKIKLMLAEDHPLARKTFPSLFMDQEEFEMIGCAENGEELLKLLNEKQPDIIFMDLEMPVMNGIKATEIVRKKYPQIKIIVLSMYNTKTLVHEMEQRGVSAYLSKNCDIDVIYSTIKKVFAEDVPPNTKAMKHTAKGLDKPTLSDREIEVLKLMHQEKSNKEISEALHISEPTVDFHRKNLYSKTGENSRIGLIKFGIREGYLGLK